MQTFIPQTQWKQARPLLNVWKYFVVMKERNYQVIEAKNVRTVKKVMARDVSPVAMFSDLQYP